MTNPILENIISSRDSDNVLIDKINTIAGDYIRSNLSAVKFKGIKISAPKKIMILGAGGTGSWLLPKLIKILNQAVTKGMSSEFSILIADGDEVEPKNLMRQNFVEQDIGKNKAQVIAERYGAHCSDKINVGFIDKYIVDKDFDVPADFSDKFSLLEDIPFFSKLVNVRHEVDFTNRDLDDFDSVLILNLIDNGRSRKAIHRFAARFALQCCKRYVANDGSRSIQIIDVANNTHNGQLNHSIYSEENNPSIDASLFYNSMPSHYGDDEEISVFSCADEDVHAVDQLFSANDMAATILSNHLNEWIQSSSVLYGKTLFTTGAAPRIDNEQMFYSLEKVLEDYLGSEGGLSDNYLIFDGSMNTFIDTIPKFRELYIQRLSDSMATYEFCDGVEEDAA